MSTPDMNAVKPLFRPELVDPVKQNRREVRFPSQVTYLREPIQTSGTPGGPVEHSVNIHLAGLGHMSLGVARTLVNGLFSAVRQGELDEREAAKAAAKARAKAAKDAG